MQSGVHRLFQVVGLSKILFFAIFVSIPLASHLGMEAVQCQDVVVSAAAWR